MIRGVTTGSRAGIDWWAQDVRNLFPDLWKPFAEAVPEAERGDLVEAYRKRLLDPDPSVHEPTAEAFWEYSTRIASFRTPEAAPPATLAQKLAGARIFYHFVSNGFFVAPGQLLAGMEKIATCPASSCRAATTW